MDSQTQMTGLFGFPVKHSLSPLMHNAAFQELGLNYAYAAFAIEQECIKEAVHGIRSLGFRGVNVTIPHKVDVMEFLDEVDEEAQEIGAVNTIVNENGKLVGYNTDGRGYVQSIIEELGINFSGKKIVIIGAGGAARGVAFALARQGVGEIVIANRSPQRAEELALHVSKWAHAKGISLSELDPNSPLDADLLINTTSVGMSPDIHNLPVPASMLHEGLIVSDLIYNPLYTELLLKARDKGAKIHSGLGMFIHQGALAFELWTGKKAPTKMMRELVLQALTKR